jgi:hypothetical protein
VAFQRLIRSLTASWRFATRHLCYQPWDATNYQESQLRIMTGTQVHRCSKEDIAVRFHALQEAHSK